MLEAANVHTISVRFPLSRSFSNITRSVFQFLDCQSVTADVSVVSTAPAIICNEGEWSLYLPLIIILLTGFVILSPMIMLGWLIKRRKCVVVCPVVCFDV